MKPIFYLLVTNIASIFVKLDKNNCYQSYPATHEAVDKRKFKQKTCIKY